MVDSTLGRDLPLEDRVPDLPMRPVSADLGQGIDADDVARGYCSGQPAPPTSDNRAGEIAPPFDIGLEPEKGFLYRGRFPTDR